MYNLPHFKEKDPAAIIAFVKQHPFAFIAGADEKGRPVATQIPVFIEEREGRLFLTGHMMKQQDHCVAFEKNPQVLCVFTGDHSYVSATWYSDPVQASTWNYMSVHLRGKISFLDEKALVEVLRKTTLHFENYKKTSSTVFDNLPEDYTRRLMKAIVAFEVAVEEMDHVFKLSQNRDHQSYQNIMQHLKQGDAGAQFIAGEMEKRENGLFNDPA